MSMFDRIAERRIQEAIERGDFDDNPLAGKPLELEDMSHIPQDLRASVIVLKNAGFVPEEIGLRGEIVRLRDLIEAVQDEGEAQTLRDELAAAEVRYELLLGRRGIPIDYRDRVLHRLSQPKSPDDD